jgi:hypothetical protein
MWATSLAKYSKGNSNQFCRTQGTKSFTLPSQRQVKTRNVTTSSGKKRVTLLPGEGIGPEVAQSVVGIFRAAGTQSFK